MIEPETAALQGIYRDDSWHGPKIGPLGEFLDLAVLKNWRVAIPINGSKVLGPVRPAHNLAYMRPQCFGAAAGQIAVGIGADVAHSSLPVTNHRDRLL